MIIGELWFDASIQDGDNVKKLENQGKDELRKIDRSNTPRKFKGRIYQHSLLPRLIWPMMLYAVLSSTIESLERITIRHLKREFIHSSFFSVVGLYGKSNQLQLPVSSLVEELSFITGRRIKNS